MEIEEREDGLGFYATGGVESGLNSTFPRFGMTVCSLVRAGVGRDLGYSSPAFKNERGHRLRAQSKRDSSTACVGIDSFARANEEEKKAGPLPRMTVLC